MAKKNLLETLIHSLNQSELKRFTLYTKTYASNKSYIDLFKSIKNNHTNKTDKNNNKLAQQRRYLYRIILESLIQKSNKSSVENEVLFYINSANYLIKKQLPEHAYDIINKALHIVKKYEMTGYHLQLIEIEKQIRMYINPKGYRSDDEIFQEEVDLIEYQKQLHTLKAVYNKILNYKKRSGYIDLNEWTKLYHQIKKMGFPDTSEECSTLKSKHYYYFNQTLLYFIRRNHQKAYDYSSKMIKVDPGPLSKREYLNGLLEHSTSCYCLGKTDETLETISMVKEFYQKGVFGKFENIALKIFYYRANYELVSYVFKGDKEMVEKKMEIIEKELTYWGDKIPIAMRMILATAFKLGYAALGNYKKMGKEINFLIDSLHSGLRLDAHEDGLIWNLMYIFSKDDLDFLENQASQAYKHFQKNNVIENMDNYYKLKITKLFLNYSKMKIDRKEFLHSFKKVLEEKLSYFDNNFLEMDYPYLMWVNSQISGKSLLQTAREMEKTHLNN